MPDWDTDVWVNLGIAAASLVLALLAWQFPRQPRRPASAVESAPPVAAFEGVASAEPQASPDLIVKTSNHLPVAVLPDGRHTSGNWLVAVTLYNRGERRVCVSSWGVQVPDGGNLVVPVRTTPFEPPLPYWVEPGTNGTWYADAEGVRTIAAERGVSFEDMRAWVSLADGRQISATAGLPLA